MTFKKASADWFVEASFFNRRGRKVYAEGTIVSPSEVGGVRLSEVEAPVNASNIIVLVPSDFRLPGARTDMIFGKKHNPSLVAMPVSG